MDKMLQLNNYRIKFPNKLNFKNTL